MLLLTIKHMLNNWTTGFLLSTALLLVFPQYVWAQSSVSLSVTPTLFDVSVEPGDLWQSSIRVINPNDQPLTVYIEPVNFTSQNERGVSNFIPVQDDGELSGLTLAEWIIPTVSSLTIEPQTAESVSFTVAVPTEAPPGGQYAALLVSTQPPVTAGDTGSQVRTTQVVSSLFFMRVEGEVIERGQIRSFRALHRVADRPQNEFQLRFENLGTVHLQPQGYISIYNMWGQRRGEIPINQSTQFGKVLPEGIRQFNFGWESAFSLVDLGRYRAEVTVAYGSSDRAFVSAETYFWVIPVTGLVIVSSTLIFFVVLLTWLIRRYIRSVLAAAGVTSLPGKRPVVVAEGDLAITATTTSSTQSTAIHWSEPLRTLWSDWKSVWQQQSTAQTWYQTLWHFCMSYRVTLLGFALIALCLLGAWLFFQIVLSDEQAYEITVTEAEQQRVISSEALQLQRYHQSGVVSQPLELALDELAEFSDTELTIRIVNVSGVAGIAATAAWQLFDHAEFVVHDVDADIHRTERRSVIVFAPHATDVAQVFSRVFGNALLSPLPQGADQAADIIIYLGRDILP